MRILGIESSCDETAAAVVEDGTIVLSDVVRSQVDLHRPYGGPVPEIASRSHLEAILPVIEEALSRAAATPESLDAIAVTHRPGLIGALLVGLAAAKGLALALGKPLVGVDHLAAHTYAAWMGAPQPPGLPFVSLIASGGHTALFRHDDPFEGVEVGGTVDDAAGECFDKVAALLGLGYPGGPIIDRLARKGDARAFAFKLPLLARGERAGLELSFSGLKTAVRYRLTGENSREPPMARTERAVADLCASFQSAVVDALVQSALNAIDACDGKALVIGGGCAANAELRARAEQRCAERGLPCFLPSRARCTDNGAMIAGLGYHLLERRGPSDLALDATPTG